MTSSGGDLGPIIIGFTGDDVPFDGVDLTSVLRSHRDARQDPFQVRIIVTDTPGPTARRYVAELRDEGIEVRVFRAVELDE